MYIVSSVSCFGVLGNHKIIGLLVMRANTALCRRLMGLAILHEALGQDNCTPQEGVVMCSQSPCETKRGPIGQQREREREAEAL